MRTATVFNFLIESTLMGSVMIVILLLVRRFLRPQLGSRLIWLAWLLIMARLLLPISLPNPMMNEIRPTLSDNVGVRPIADQVRVRTIDAAYDLANAVRTGGYSNPGTASLALRDFGAQTSYGHTARWVLLAYSLVAALVAAGMTWQNVRFMRKLKRDRVEALSGEALEQYDALCKKRKVSPVPVYWVDPLPSACLVGVFRPYIALPLTLNRQDLTPALLHEMCHQKAGDPWRNLLRNLCCVVHWFNPLVWAMAHICRTDQELACDERVTAPMTDEERIDYANTLATAAARRNAPDMAVLATGMTMKGRHIKQRVSAIVNGKAVVRWLCVAALATAVVGTLFAFATAEYLPPLKMPDVMPLTGTPIERHAVSDAADALAYGQQLLEKAYGVDESGMGWHTEDRSWQWRVTATADEGNFWEARFDDSGMLWRLDMETAGVGFTGPRVAGNPTYKTNAEYSAPYEAYVRSFAAQLLPDQPLDGLFLETDFWCMNNRYLSYRYAENYSERGCTFYLQIEPEVRMVAFERFDSALAQQLEQAALARRQRQLDEAEQAALQYEAGFFPLSHYGTDTPEGQAVQSAHSHLTEVYSYSYEEAARFVYAIAEVDGVQYCVFHHPDLPALNYTFEIGNASNWRSPYRPNQRDKSESGLRYFLDVVAQNAWLTRWQAEDQLAYARETGNVLYDLNWMDRPFSMPAGCSPAEAVQAAFEAYYGPQDNWNEGIVAWRDYALLRFGLAAQPIAGKQENSGGM